MKVQGHTGHGGHAHVPNGDHGDGHGHAAHGHVHVMPLKLLFTIFAALIFFTIATVVISKFHLGAWEVPITMAIATTKAILVAVYFMHLRYDNPFNAMIFCFALFFVALFLGGTLIDVSAYQKDLIPPTSSPTP
jgi:cytochrome c oxidase subunit 4